MSKLAQLLRHILDEEVSWLLSGHWPRRGGPLAPCKLKPGRIG